MRRFSLPPLMPWPVPSDIQPIIDKSCVLNFLPVYNNKKWLDYSVFRNHGTIHGATWTTGKFCSALSFDGSDDYVEIPDSASLDIIRNLSIETWVKPFGWEYRKLVNLSSSTPEDNFQIKIELNTSNFDYSKAQPNGEDIRFYTLNGTKLSYWIEEWNASGTSTIWVKIPQAGTEQIYMYYGNPFAEDESNIFNTSAFGAVFTGSFNSSSIKERYKRALQKIADYIENDYLSHNSTGQIGTDTDDVRSQEVCEFFASWYLTTNETKYKDMAIDVANWAIDNLQGEDGYFLESGWASYARTAFFTWALAHTYKMLENELNESTKTKWLNSMTKASDWLYNHSHVSYSNQVMGEMLAHYYVYLCTGNSIYQSRAFDHHEVIMSYWVQVDSDKGYFKEGDGYDRHYSQLHLAILLRYYKVSGDDYFNEYCQQIWNWLRDALDFNTFYLDNTGNTRTTGNSWWNYARKLSAVMELAYGVITDSEYDVREIARKAFLSVVEPDVALHGVLVGCLDWTCSDLMKTTTGAGLEYFTEEPDVSFEWGSINNLYMWSQGSWHRWRNWLLMTGESLMRVHTSNSPAMGIYSLQNLTNFSIKVKVRVINTTQYGCVELLGAAQNNTVAWTSNSLYYNEIGYDNQRHDLCVRNPTNCLNSSSFPFNLNEWITLELRKIGNSLESYANDNYLLATDDNFSSGYVGFGGYTSDFEIEYIFTRKLTSPEISATFGEEEYFQWQRIITKDSSSDKTCNYYITLKNARYVEAGWYDGSSWHTIIDYGHPLESQKWHHIVYTYNGTQRRLYIDGELVNTKNEVANLTPTSYSLKIGKSGWYGYYFHGNIDEVRIYDRVLTAEEIKRLYEWSRSRHLP